MRREIQNKQIEIEGEFQIDRMRKWPIIIVIHMVITNIKKLRQSFIFFVLMLKRIQEHMTFNIKEKYV